MGRNGFRGGLLWKWTRGRSFVMDNWKWLWWKLCFSLNSLVLPLNWSISDRKCSPETPKNQFREASSSFPRVPIVTTEISHSNFTLNIIIKHLFNQKMWQSTRKGLKLSPRLPPHNQYTNKFPHMHWNSPHPKPNECEKWKVCVVCSSKRIKNSMKCKPQSVMRVKFAVCSQMI